MERTLSCSGDELVFGPFRIVPLRRIIERDGEPIKIGSRAFEILIALVDRAGEVVSKAELLSCVWQNTTVDDGALRVHIVNLRRVLGEDQNGVSYITCVSGRGYCFVAPVERVSAERSSAASGAAAERISPSFPLSRPLRRMFGRDETVDELRAQLMAKRFVTIVGPGGIGKTTVATAIAHTLLATFAGAVAFVDLSVLTDSRLVGVSIAATLGLQIQSQDPIVALGSYLRTHPMLIVLDNCEHVIDAVAAISERITTEAPETYVLATSRETLRVEGEYVYWLQPLRLPPGEDLVTAGTVESFPAVRLFLERAVAGGARLELTDAEAAIVARICIRLDGIALAIELVASRVAVHGLQGTADLLDNCFCLIWQGRRTAQPRHQTLNALLDWSYNLLVASEQDLLKGLSVFVGPFSFEAARAVATNLGDISLAEALESLVEKSLLSTSVDQGRPRYRLLVMTRAYAAKKSIEDGESDEAARCHVSYIAGCLREQELSFASRHLGDVRAALVWCFSDSGDPRLGVQLAVNAAPLLLRMSLLTECLDWGRRALAALDADERGTVLEVRLYEATAIAAMFTQGNTHDVRDALLHGLELAEALEDQEGQMRLLAGLNILEMRMGNFRSGLAIAERYHCTAQRRALPAASVTADWMLGVAHHVLGNQAEAQRRCESGLARAKFLSPEDLSFFGYDHRIRAMVALARTLWFRGYPDQAAKLAYETIDEAVELEQPVNICIALIYSAPVFMWRGDWIAAERTIDQLIAYAKRNALAPYHMVGLGLRGELAVRTGEPEQGLWLLNTALQALNTKKYHIQATQFGGAIAEGLICLGRFMDALGTIDHVIQQIEQKGSSYNWPEMLCIKGRVLRAMGKAGCAETVWTRGLALAEQQSASSLMLRIATELTRLRPERGGRILSNVLDGFAEGADTLDLREAKKLLGVECAVQEYGLS